MPVGKYVDETYLSPDVVTVDDPDRHAGHMPLLQQLPNMLLILLGERAASYNLILTRDRLLRLTPRRRGAQCRKCNLS